MIANAGDEHLLATSLHPMATYRRSCPPTAQARLTRLLCGTASCLTLLGCSSFVIPLPTTRTVTIQLPATAVADDVTVTPVVVLVDTTIAVDKRVVALATTAGQFVGDVSALIPDASGRVLALLRAPMDSTTAVIHATVNGGAATAQLVYQRARAERIDLVPEQFTLSAGLTNEIKIAATLRRAVGLPSPGGVVTFTATNAADQQPVGRFLPVSAVVDAQGVATVRFTTADTAARGRVDIHATSDTARASAAIEVLAP